MFPLSPGLLPPPLNALEREITELACHIHVPDDYRGYDSQSERIGDRS